jgi:hypothetical protein
MHTQLKKTDKFFLGAENESEIEDATSNSCVLCSLLFRITASILISSYVCRSRRTAIKNHMNIHSTTLLILVLILMTNTTTVQQPLT